MKIAFISDIHSNQEALQAILRKIKKMKVDKIYSIGDVIGYGGSPNECIELINEKDIPSVLSNHEWAVLHQDTTWFNPVASEAIFWTIDHLDKKHFDWLRRLPEKNVVSVSGYKILLVHGSPRDPIFEYVSEETVDENFVKRLDFDVIVVGHTHIPFVKKVEGSLVINSGSVGQPRDHNPKASFVVFDPKKFDAKIIRVEYDIKKSADKIIKSGLPPFLAQRLFSGV